jgi:hypothetical protein
MGKKIRKNRMGVFWVLTIIAAFARIGWMRNQQQSSSDDLIEHSLSRTDKFRTIILLSSCNKRHKAKESYK